ncbi:chemotaxis protein [Enterovirga aerilata]|uniref:Chemotaxis protein n=1 Tax=Enterovirga aerilata TaxID=2730920 RepID=A0A849I483_9HYPH|nr:chemotaxis protein [Enterovirga sp. DB1703]NNM72484.1 chemotaxis protein [Enterovirga sp. DB1703]
MRRIADILRRAFRHPATLDLTPSDMRPAMPDPAGEGRGCQPSERRKLELIAREIGQVADYVTRLKREIRALKAGEVSAKRMPATITDLRGVHEATRSAAETIMAAAEAILARDSRDADYRAFVADRVTEIMQACSFEDLAGQRLDRAMETLQDVERRLGRFAKAVKIADAADRFDRRTIMREARREVLLVEGPQNGGAAIKQADIDEIFR